MSGGNRFRYWAILGVALILAACNRPDLVDPTETPSPQLLSLEQIYAAVAATLVIEGELTAAARPSDTPSSDKPSATPASLSTSALTLTSTSTPTSSPTANPTLVPPTKTSAPTSTSTLKPTDKPASLPPTNTPCPKFTNATLSARPGSSGVDLAWGASGGCGPYDGVITVTYEGESGPYAKYEVKGASGKLFDPRRCEGSFTITYVLNLSDNSGQIVTAKDTAKATWKC